MQVNVGIFWVIKGKVYCQKEGKEKESASKDKRTKLTGIMDSGLGHFKVWNIVYSKRFPLADFAKYPRGRVVFDLKKNEHIIYADDCISIKKIGEIVKAFGIEKYRVEKDEHYSCDKCVKRKKLWED